MTVKLGKAEVKVAMVSLTAEQKTIIMEALQVCVDHGNKKLGKISRTGESKERIINVAKTIGKVEAVKYKLDKAFS